MREPHRRIQERFPRRPLELSPLFGQRLPPAAACLRLQLGQSVSSSATAESVALDTNRNAARPALQNRRSHSSNGALHPGSSRHGLALASPVRQTRARPQYQLATSCVANPVASHVRAEPALKTIFLLRHAALRPLCGLSTPRATAQTPKTKKSDRERQNFNSHELSRLDHAS